MYYCVCVCVQFLINTMNRLKLNIRYTVKEGDAGKKVRIPANITEALGEAKFAKSNNELEFVLPKHAKVGKIIELAAPDGDIIRCVCAPKGNNTSHMMMCWCMSTFFMFIVISSLIINVYNPLSLLHHLVLQLHGSSR
jgi:hypothetical protein